MGKMKSLLYERTYGKDDQRPAHMLKSEKRTLWILGRLYVFESEDEMRKVAKEVPLIADALRREGRIVI